MSKADQADIYSIIENSASLTYSLQVQPTRLLELNNDHGAVDGYPQDMFIDYYNTYTTETYNLQDVIDKLNAEETSDSIRSLSQDQLIQLTNERRTAGSIRQKTRLSTKLYLVVVVERCHRWKFPSPDEWVVNKDSVEVTTTIQGTSRSIQTFYLETQQQEL